jgi:acyl-CoA thioester hydrolase
MMPRVSKSRFRVRYAETDQMGVVYYANYFVWMEIGRSDYCRDCGFSYRTMEAEDKAFIAVVDANCRYLSPARYDDEITVETQIARMSRRVLEFTYVIRSQQGLVAEGRTVHVVMGPDGKAKSMSNRYFELLQESDSQTT